MNNRTWAYSGTKETQVSKRERIHAQFAREAASEGMVLLKNESLLPLNITKPVALLGAGALFTVKGGIGSGDVNNRETISIYRGFQDAGAAVTSTDWLSRYQNQYEAARNKWKEKVRKDAQLVENPFDAYSMNPFSIPHGDPIADGDIDGADTAIYVISRICGEGKDRKKAAGDYYLSQKEREDLLFLNQKHIQTVLVLNAGGPLELTDILQDAPNIKAVLNISLPGQEAGHAVSDAIFGKSMPGGRLAATWARRYEDYPSAESYSHLNGNLTEEEYREGIYVGYRYFDSFGIQPLYPFGYGLSYTDFSIRFEKIQAAGKGPGSTANAIELTVTVQNTGTHYSGREVVQVYITPPQTGLTKELRRLAGFAKTDTLAPNASQALTITIAQKQLASFSQEMHAWVAEAGKYLVWIGKDIASLQLAACILIPETAILEHNKDICPQHARMQCFGIPEYTKMKAASWLKEIEGQAIPEITFLPKEEPTPACQAAYAKELDTEKLIPLLYGNITQGASTLGSAGIRVPGSAGETSEALETISGIRSLIMADGPAGLRLRQSYQVDKETGAVYGAGVLASLENGFLEEAKHHENADTYYQYCTAFPVGTLLAQTWDTNLLYQFGKAIAAEMQEFHVDLWLAPGMNIQRNPLCGRNFEYYSEDPFLTGTIAAAVTAGVQENGKCGVTAKHFACNNQEDNRMGVNACISQQALREIYLRGFEIVVKQSSPAAIMTSYNQINGVHAANSKCLCTVAARQEWGFEGIIMSDWNTTVPSDGSIPWKCAEAGNDIIMPGNLQDDKDIREAFEQGKLSEHAIRSCAGRIIKLIQQIG